MKILNLTLRSLAPEQELEGAVDLSEDRHRGQLRELLTFEDPPSRHVLLWRAAETVRLLREWNYVPVVAAALIGGPPWYLPYLAAALRREGVTPLHAFAPGETGEAEDGCRGRRPAAFVEWPSQYDVSFFRH